MRHFAAALTKGVPDASSVAWGGLLNTTSGTSPAGGVLPPDWGAKHFNHKEMHALYHLRRQFCERHPDLLRRAQVLIDMNN